MSSRVVSNVLGSYVSWSTRIVIPVLFIIGLCSLILHVKGYYMMIRFVLLDEPYQKEKLSSLSPLLPDKMAARSDRLKRKCLQYERQLDQAYRKGFGSSVRGNIFHKADILVDRKRQFFFCKVPKVASTSWVNHLLPLYHMNPDSYPIGFRHTLLRRQMYRPESVSIGTADGQDNFLKDQGKYFSFLTVRHPFDRILSAYRDKFFAYSNDHTEQRKSKKFASAFGQDIIKKFRQSALPENTAYSRVPTFPEFVEYLRHTKVEEYNEHWMPIYLHCLPCVYEFSVITKLENLSEESSLVLGQLGLPTTMNKGHVTGNDKPTDNVHVQREYFGMLTKDAIKDLYKIYKYDFELFGYSVEPFLSYSH